MARSEAGEPFASSERRRRRRAVFAVVAPEVQRSRAGPGQPRWIVDVWYFLVMSHILVLSHFEQRVRLGDRGRLVLPAEIRRTLGLEPGDELLARVEDDEIRLISRRQVARNARGTLKELAPSRDLVAELLDERRTDAAHE